MKIKHFLSALQGVDGDMEITFFGVDGIIVEIEDADGIHVVVDESMNKIMESHMTIDEEPVDFEERIQIYTQEKIVSGEDLHLKGFKSPKSLPHIMDDDTLPYRQYITTDGTGRYLILADVGNDWYLLIMDSLTFSGLSKGGE